MEAQAIVLAHAHHEPQKLPSMVKKLTPEKPKPPPEPNEYGEIVNEGGFVVGWWENHRN